MAKTIFITGASSGIGKATARFFQAKGWHVIATMRHPEKETELTGLENVTVLPLDVTSPEQILTTVQKAIALRPIDVVVNNAAFGIVGALEGTTDQDMQRILDTNVLGVIRVTRAFLPHFRERQSGVLISISSEGGFMAYPYFSLYHATKWAVEGWTESMAFELKPFGIQIKTILPGPTQTDFGNAIITAVHPDYEAGFNKFTNGYLMEEMVRKFQPVDLVTAVIYQAATDGKDQLRYLAGAVADSNYDKRMKLGADLFHKELEKAAM
ncbi:Short-chain dehydrogenase [Arachidicoccus rhizosphaerae]|uniref:Short-chain dehydrogenase n=1 Tax=Arachidicoccus rhizosphaerae TaxID=551991 RepID=A0A1H3XRD7_9BACT|nr:SDR family oxidoreductase [Arachidicoccus rhizosphaerae]SEA01790.1 Short-chain dehydrogenase [Arachidicoccus rhizosphaerae]